MNRGWWVQFTEQGIGLVSFRITLLLNPIPFMALLHLPQSQKSQPSNSKRPEGYKIRTCSHAPSYERRSGRARKRKEAEQMASPGRNSANAAGHPNLGSTSSGWLQALLPEGTQGRGKGDSKSLPPTWEPAGDYIASVTLHSMQVKQLAHVPCLWFTEIYSSEKTGKKKFFFFFFF